ncbi:hypothetical protein, partial [Brevibacillus sp. MCWH]|uniref:hypothetical protein n=1 Tax=Brevibacillus sp. MCWH TaxID=2508871 RepID=UPI001490FAF9
MEKMKMFYFLICMSMFTLLVGFVGEENKKEEEITQTLNSLNNSYTELKTILENNIEIKETKDNEDFYVPTVKDKKELENIHEENSKIYVQVKTEYLNVRKE